MEDMTDSYTQFVLEKVNEARKLCANPLILIETTVDFGKYVPNGFGTADCLIAADETLRVIDLKYGTGVVVSADHNAQLMCYALGALETFGNLYDITNVEMSIFQPRRENIETCTMSVAELLNWAENTLKPKAELAFKGEGNFNVGDWCQFCKAAVKCRARAEANLRLAQAEFALPPVLTDDEIADVLERIPNMVKWGNDIMAYATEAAVNHGKKWRGFKVVAGRSVRKYADENKVAEAAKAAGYDDIFEKKLITLTAMEKLMGKKKFNEVMAGLIVKPQGKLTLVPVSDKRPEITVNNANDEFKSEVI